jgi:hypothetical protein
VFQIARLLGGASWTDAAMQFDAGKWVIGCTCAKCKERSALLPDKAQGIGPIDVPFSGAFSFRCRACGADNVAVAGDLLRFQVGLATRSRTVSGSSSVVV